MTMSLSPWFVYFVRTNKGALYCGVTTDVARRFHEHQTCKKGAKYLKGKGPLTLAWSQQVLSKRDAMQFEYRIKKRLSKQQKEQLIQENLCLYTRFANEL